MTEQLEEMLRAAIRTALQGEAVLFLGAGAAKAARNAMNLALPSGQQLADALATSSGLPSGYALDAISQHFLDERGETALIAALREQLDVASIETPLLALAAMPWLRIWTTNYDDSFEQALTQHKKTHYSLTTAADPKNAQGARLLVLHINGSLKKLAGAMTSDFILTSQAYATQSFAQSDWSTIFRHDLQRARAIFFIGYSLADIDIARLVFDPDLFKSKIYFIDYPGVDKVLLSKLTKFGNVYPIGLPSAEALIKEEKAGWTAPALVENYQCWSPLDVSKSAREPSDDDAYQLILQGALLPELLSYQLLHPTNAGYVAHRSDEEACVRHLGSEGAVAVVLGSFANGKTVMFESVANRIASSGRDVFMLTAPGDAAHTELQRLCRRERDFVLALENYSRNIDLIECFAKYARTSCTILTTERMEVHELRVAAIEDRAKSRDLRYFDLDVLDNREISEFSRLLDLRGLWGERAALSPAQKAQYITHDCGRQLHALLLDVVNAPQIQKRLAEVVSQFQSIERGADILIVLCLLQAIGEQPRIDIVAELLQLSYDTFRNVIKNEVTRRILAVDTNVALFRSPVIANSVLASLPNAATITSVASECVKRCEIIRRVDTYYSTISKELSRFANLERFLPDKGKRAALQNFYEEIKTVPAVRANPHFWLQYAMARLSLGELKLARAYFEQSYSYARKLDGYDTFQIDNHYSRLLFREAEDAENADQAFSLVDEALKILKKQVLRENRHYPFRSAWSLEGVARRHASTWTVDQRESVIAASKYLIDAASRLEDHVARSVAVVGGLERLRRVVATLG